MRPQLQFFTLLNYSEILYLNILGGGELAKLKATFSFSNYLQKKKCIYDAYDDKASIGEDR